jgi:hypothetical protein
MAASGTPTAEGHPIPLTDRSSADPCEGWYGCRWPNLLAEDGGPKSHWGESRSIATAVPAAEPVSSPRRPRGLFEV